MNYWTALIEGIKGAAFYLLAGLGITLVTAVSFGNFGQSLIDELQETYNGLGAVEIGIYEINFIDWLGMAGVDDFIEIQCAAWLISLGIGAAKVSMVRR